MSISGYQTKVGIGLEGTAGTAVKAQGLLHFRSDNVEGQFNNIISSALVYGRFAGGAAPGNETVSGQIVSEVTPDKISRLIYAALGKDVVSSGAPAVASISQAAGVATVTTTPDHGFETGDTVTVSGCTQTGYNLTAVITKTGAKTFTYAVDAGTVSPATGAPAVLGPYRHTVTPTQAGPKALTHLIAKGLVDAAGSIVQVHPGCYVDNLELSADIDQFLIANADLVGTGPEKVYGYTTANDTALFATAAASALNPYSYVQGALTLNSVANEECRNIRIRIANAMREKRAIKRQRAALGYAPGQAEITLDAQMYFSTDAERRRLMGVAAAAAYPFTSTTSLITGSASLDFASGAAGLTIALANLVYTAAGEPVESDDYIMQPLTARVAGDSTGGITITVKNAEALIADNGTNVA